MAYSLPPPERVMRGFAAAVNFKGSFHYRCTFIALSSTSLSPTDCIKTLYTELRSMHYRCMHARLDRVLSELGRRGVLTPREMQEVIGASAATLSRLLSDPDSRQIIRMGKARATRYGLRRDVRGMGSEWPLYRIEGDGSAALQGHLYALTRGQWLLQQDDPWDSLLGDAFREGLYPGLPWFLQDLRPRGFLGRLLARRYAGELGAPSDPRDWSDDDVAVSLWTLGGDLPGSFVLGRRALAAAQSAMRRDDDVIPAQARATTYPARAATAMAGDVPGSSAAGEQPKFTARVRREDNTVSCVIVKFSGAGGRPEDRRWCDLLMAEHVANGVLAQAGIPCATTALLQAEGRCFLESSRFDRIGQGGRRGFVSLEALDSAFFGAIGTSWDEAAVRCRDAGWLSGEDAERLALLWWFGTLIGNTDMHYGNAGLFLDSTRPLSLAPIYDMLPMLYCPDAEGRLPEASVAPQPPPPESRACWSRAAGLARKYWRCLSGTEHVSESFRALSARNAKAVAALR